MSKNKVSYRKKPIENVKEKCDLIDNKMLFM